MNQYPLSLLLSIIVMAIIFASCKQDQKQGIPGGRAATEAVRGGQAPEPKPIEVLMDGRPYRKLHWEDLKHLPQIEIDSPGVKLVETGYPLLDVLKELDITSAESVDFFGRGSGRSTLIWEEISDRKSKIILTRTHKGTLKVSSGNPDVLPPSDWVRHLSRINVRKGDASQE